MIKLTKLLIREETFDTEVPAIKIHWDRLPHPTEETRRVLKVPCRATRLTARNILGKLLCKGAWGLIL